MLVRRFTVALLVTGALLGAKPAAAQMYLPCPIAADDLVGPVLATSVSGGVMADPLNPTQALDTGGNTVCMWDIDGGENMLIVTRAPEAFGVGGATDPTDLAVKQSRLPAEAREELQAMRDAGINDIQVPDYQISPAAGLGDKAVWVFQHEPTLDVPSGGFIVQRGVDALAFSIVGQDEATAKVRALAVAQAVLATLP
jgi:hypothetical protein